MPGGGRRGEGRDARDAPRGEHGVAGGGPRHRWRCRPAGTDGHGACLLSDVRTVAGACRGADCGRCAWDVDALREGVLRRRRHRTFPLLSPPFVSPRLLVRVCASDRAVWRALPAWLCGTTSALLALPPLPLQCAPCPPARRQWCVAGLCLPPPNAPLASPLHTHTYFRSKHRRAHRITRPAPILPAHAISTPHTPHPYPHANAHTTTHSIHSHARVHTYTHTHTHYTHTLYAHLTHTLHTHHLQAMKKMKTKMIIEGDLTKLRYGRRHERRGIRIRRKHDQNVNRAEKKRLRRVLRRINVIRNRETN